ncbi:InlB B-repeat-containing protein [Marinilabiliaceae bacterium ANBcel2]|nr:InlB B-repeat-containing protein [Marinilabiliaceae bacterium ANBcel2]
MKFLSTLFTLFFAGVVITAQTSVAPSNGDGSSESPFEIETLENLYWISQNENVWDNYFIQTEDIDASETAGWFQGDGWTPIGAGDSHFAGVYDGGGKVIYGLYVNYDSPGLFSSVIDGQIMNLELVDVYIKGFMSVGALAGSVENGVIKNCGVTGEIVGNSIVGGLLGYVVDSEIINSFSKGVVDGQNIAVGGLAANLFNSDVYNCYSLADVFSPSGNNTPTAGLIGSLNGDSKVRYCYSAGLVSAGQRPGGLVAAGGSTDVEYSFWDIESSGWSSSHGEGVEGLSTPVMSQKQNYSNVGWDFKGDGEKAIWNMGSGRNSGYPYLNWQFPDDVVEQQPVISLDEVEDVNAPEASLMVTIHVKGDPEAERYGLIYNSSGEFGIEDDLIEIENVHEGSESIILTGLSSLETYYVKAFIENENGVYYTREFSFDVPISGSGELHDPYRISCLNSLQWMYDNPDKWDGYFVQTQNIDASETENWNDGSGWAPLGNSNEPFTGNYNGGGYFISDIYIDRSNEDNVGFFGVIQGATIERLGIIDANITGKERVGILLGLDSGESDINRSFSKGTVSGNFHVGGLAGRIMGDSQIFNCYTISNVDANSQGAGGFVGETYSSIGYSYAVNEIPNTYNAYPFARLSGSNSELTNCFWDKDVAGSITGNSNEGRLTAQMHDFYNYADTRWDFKGLGYEGVWNIDSDFNQGYPFLSWEYPLKEGPTDVLPTFNVIELEYDLETGLNIEFEVTNIGNPAVDNYGLCWNFSGNPKYLIDDYTQNSINSPGVYSVEYNDFDEDLMYYMSLYIGNDVNAVYGEELSLMNPTPPQGDGTDDNPYHIETLNHLYWFTYSSEEWDNHFLQIYSIDASETEGWYGGRGWLPVAEFTGVYDGGYNVIENLFVNRPNDNNVGFIGRLLSGKVKNLGVVDVSFKGSERVGGLIGGTWVTAPENRSEISNSFSTGEVEGHSNVGGFVGRLTYVDVSNCYSNANVTVNVYGGGFAGGILECNLFNCYSSGFVEGPSNYSFGFVGNVLSSNNIENCFWDIEASGQTDSNVGVGKTTEQMKSVTTYTAIGVEGLNRPWDFMDNPYDDDKTVDYWGIDEALNDGYPFLKWQYYPTVEISQIEIIDYSTVKASGKVLSDGFSNVISRGFVMDTEPYPDVIDGFTFEAGEATGEYDYEIPSLAYAQTYYLRPYAENENGYSYGQQEMFITDYPTGSGSEQDPYLIYNAAHLYWISQNPDSWESYFVQMDDIELIESQNWNEGYGWSPIGNKSEPFMGSYDGGGYNINNLFINRPETDYVGLFGSVYEAKLVNINIQNGDVTGGDNSGILAGYVMEECEIENCVVTGELTGMQHVGSLAGNMRESSHIYNCSASTTVTGGGYCGGLVGELYRNSTVTQSSFNGSVNGDSYCGGVVGYCNMGSEVHESYSVGEVNGSLYVGGVVGGTHAGDVRNSYSHSNVTGENNVGGLAGRCAHNSTVYNSYSTGEVISTGSNVGGLVGGGYATTINASYWDVDSSNMEQSALGGEGLSSLQMRVVSNFLDGDWMFKGYEGDEIWNIGNERNNGYPYLNWQYPDDNADNPTVISINEIRDITNDGAEIVYEIHHIGDPLATEYGICWNSIGSPDINDEIINLGEADDTGVLTYTLSGLDSDATYYVRTYATNENGTSYSKESSFYTAAFEVIVDINPENAGEVSGSGTYYMNEEVTLTAENVENYSLFLNWSDDSGIIVDEQYQPVGTLYKFTMPAKDLNITANFEIIDYSVGVEAIPSNGGDYSGDGNYNYGDEVSLEAVAAEGYNFDGWYYDDNMVHSEELYIFDMPADNMFYYAHFSLKKFNLIYNSGDGGSLTGETEQIVDYGSDGTAVEAVPDYSYYFTEWSDGVTDNPRTDINVTDDINVTANFDLINYTLNYSSSEGGYIDGNKEQTVEHGSDALQVEAIANEGYYFTEWSDGVIDNLRIDVDVTSDIDVTAQFELFSFNLTYNSGDNGEISGEATQTVNYGLNGSVVEAVPADGYYFTEWSDGVTDNPRIDVDVTDDINVTAQYNIYSYTLNYSSESGGEIAGETTQTVEHGSDALQVEAIANEGYYFDAWSDGVTDNPRTDIDVTSDIDVTAQFKVITYTLYYYPETGGSVDGETSQTVSYGSNGTTVEAVPNSGYYFIEWSDGVTDNPRTDMDVKDDINVAAQFERFTYSVNYTVDEGGVVEGETEQIVKHGDNSSQVVAVAFEGYEFFTWSDGNRNAQRIDNFVTGDIDVEAIFHIITFTIQYGSGMGGSVEGATIQNIDYGDDSEEVKAMAREGYYFTEWSDGVTDNPRVDVNVTADLNVTAQFERYSYTVTYLSGEGGTIVGETIQTVEHGSFATEVEAVPDEGYQFVEWSDGETDSYRLDVNITSDFTITAEFAPVVSIGKVEGEELSLYPIPATDVVYVRGLNAAKNYNYRLFNITGELALTGEISNDQIDVSGLSAGVYIVVIDDYQMRIIIK